MIEDFRVENTESSKFVKKIYFKDRFLMYINSKEVNEFLEKINKNINCYSLPQIITKSKYEEEFTPIIFFAITKKDKETVNNLLIEYGYSYKDEEDIKDEDKNVFLTYMSSGIPCYTIIDMKIIEIYRNLDYLRDNEICDCGMKVENVKRELLFFNTKMKE